MNDERKNFEIEEKDTLYDDFIDVDDIESKLREESFSKEEIIENDIIVENTKFRKPEKTKKKNIFVKILIGIGILFFILLCFIGFILGSTLMEVLKEKSYNENLYFETTLNNNQKIPIDLENIKIESTLTFNEEKEKIHSNVEKIVENVLPSMVIIEVFENVKETNTNEETLLNIGSASGIIVGKNETELLILTNEHVITNIDKADITFIDEKKYEAKIKGYDVASDIAILAIPLKDIDTSSFEAIRIATMGNSNALNLGEQVVVIGNSLGYGQSITVGYISALNREITDSLGYTRTFIQSDAAINEGNSGGALINMNGEIVGITESKLVSVDTEGVGWSIPISTYKDIIELLMNQETKEKYNDETKGYFGVSCLNVDEFMTEAYGIPQGVYISKTSEGGAAEEGGILKGDVILMVDNKIVLTSTELINLLDYYKKGEEINVVFARLIEGEYLEFKTTIRLKGIETIENLN